MKTQMFMISHWLAHARYDSCNRRILRECIDPAFL